jgi:hypothetical protein
MRDDGADDVSETGEGDGRGEFDDDEGDGGPAQARNEGIGTRLRDGGSCTGVALPSASCARGGRGGGTGAMGAGRGRREQQFVTSVNNRSRITQSRAAIDACAPRVAIGEMAPSTHQKTTGECAARGRAATMRGIPSPRFSASKMPKMRRFQFGVWAVSGPV